MERTRAAGRFLLNWTAVVAVLAISQAAAADFPLTWRWSNPRPHGNNIIDMAYTNSLWIQIAERGQIYSTGDLALWTPRESHTTNALRAITLFNGRVVIVGENGTVVYGDALSDLKVVSLGTSDWLEGVAASPNLLVAVGDNAAVYTSPNGADWQRRSVPFTNWLRSVAFGVPNGVGTFVTVGEAGLIATSTDGIQWQRRNPGITSADLNKVIWDNGQFWTVGTGGQVLASLTGVAWSPVSTGATNTLNAIVGRADSRIVAGDSELRLFEGRGPWSDELSTTKISPAPPWTYLSAVTDGNSYFLGGRSGMFVEGFKTNSASSPTFWSPVAESPRNWLWDVKRFSGVYIAVGDRGTVMSSLDGISWDLEFVPDAAATSIFLGVGGRTNMAVAVGNGGTVVLSPEEFRSVVSTNANGTRVTNQVSTLGIVWYAVPRPTSNDLQGVAFWNNQFVVTGGAGTILTSPNGTNWTRRAAGVTAAFLSSVEAFPGGLVAVGKDGTILTSADSVTWTRRNSGTANWIYRLRYLGGRLVAVGQNGTILTSADGVNWSPQRSGTTRWLNDVQYVENVYFAIGTQGTVLTSANAIDWADRGTITQKSLYGAASHEGQLVVVGLEGAILRSQIRPLQSPVLFLQYPHNASQNVFLFAGRPDQRFTLDRSTNLKDWIPGAKLEFLDSSGTLLHVDRGTNSAPAQFFRARPSN